MKILEIVTNLSSGGAERFVVDLSNELCQSNEITLLVLKDDTKSSYGFYKHELSDKINYINLRFGDGKSLSYLWKVYKTIKNINADIVHMHSVTQYCALAVFLLHHKFKFFQTVHNDITKIGNILHYKLAFRVFGKLGWIKFITISHTNHIDMGKYYPKCVNTLIYNGRKPQHTTEKLPAVKEEINRLKKTANTTVLIHVARFSAQKNQQILVQAFNKLTSNKADSILLIIGNNFNSEEGKLLQAESCKEIYFLGTRTNIADYMACSDIFVLSSLYEGMPISLIEAIQSGLAILSTPVCGVIDVVKSGVNGVISSDYGEDSFYTAMKNIIDNKTRYLQAAQSSEFTNSFSIVDTAKQYIDWFNK